MKHDDHSFRRSSSPVNSETSDTSLQKQVGQTDVQLPHDRHRSATPSQRGCSRLRSKSSGNPSVSSRRWIFSLEAASTSRRAS